MIDRATPCEKADGWALDQGRLRLACVLSVALCRTQQEKDTGKTRMASSTCHWLFQLLLFPPLVLLLPARQMFSAGQSFRLQSENAVRFSS